MKRLLLLFVLATGSLISFGQSIPASSNICGTMQQDSINRLKYPGMQTIDEFEFAINNRIKEIRRERTMGRTQETVVTIPIVVHVIHNGEAVGTGTNLSQAQIKAQLDVLNEDFRKKAGTPGFNNNPVGADIQVEFCLSPVDKNGVAMAEPGIDRVRGSRTSYDQNYIEGTLKPTTIWNPNFFFNVWTLNFGGTAANLLGYAQFPTGTGLAGLDNSGVGKNAQNTDGVVIRYSSFGSVDKGTFPVMQAPYNRGRTLSHETGHWLGLRHIWGDGRCADDFVGDTPTHHAENRGCPVTKLSCDGVNFEMPQNYMDYSDDACMNIFTEGQKDRIRAVLDIAVRRKTLYTGNLCAGVVTAPPVARFDADNKLVLRGGEVSFVDLSTNFPSEWQWTFEGGNPATSNIQNPKVTYTTPGKFKVSLITSNSKGSSPLLEVSDFIEVSERGLCDSLTNFKDTYTPSVLKLKQFADSTGYLTGQNQAKDKAVSEVFGNTLGYAYVSGALIKFGKVYAKTEGATAKITLWNARGVQNGPGSVIESKTVLLKQIIADVAANRPTLVTFDRETPVFSKAFHVGVELTYAGDTLAVESSANGQATNLTSWVKGPNDLWQPYSIRYGANIAMNIVPITGMYTSVQVASSKIFINPGEEVILSARGASIFIWNADDNTVKNVIGPQLIVHPVTTTTYETDGSGLDLCNNSARTTIYVKQGAITGLEENVVSNVTLFPNPGTNTLNISFENSYRGPVQVELRSMLNQPIHVSNESKSQEKFDTNIDTSAIPAGVYITSVKIGDKRVFGKWVKR